MLTTVSGFNKWKNKNRRWTYPPSRVPRSERIHWQGDGILSLPDSFSIASCKCRHVPLSPTTSWPLQASLSSVLKSSQWTHGFWWGQGPLWHHHGPRPAWSSVSRCQRADQQTRSHFLSAHHVVPQMVPVLIRGCYLCLRLMFTSLRQKAKELQGKVLCGGHFLIWQNLPEHAQDCLEITLLWLFFVVLMYFNSEVGRRTWPE